ncbi:MAG TPA: cytochrome P450 [Caulobacteraceae bacterium]|nr:cytochrome P450 [Caulobacteraceae bacterium]
MTLAPSTLAPASYRLSKPLEFDIVSARAKQDPFPIFAAMRQAGPVIPIRLPFVGRVWVTTTHEATEAMVKDNALFVQEGRHAGKSGVAGFSWWMPRPIKLMTNNMLQKDEPDHRRLRHLVDKAFARRDILAMRGDVERIADKLIDGFAGRAEIDLVDDYARPLPLAVICDLLGLPEDDRAEFSAMAQQVVSINNVMGLFLAVPAFNRMLEYARKQVEAARRTPRAGLIGELVLAEEAGDKLSEDELIAMIVVLLFAGFETTRHLIADSVLILERQPDKKAWLLADPAARMERAVEELARYASPVQSTKPRFVTRDTDFFGVQLARGELVMALLASANGDPAVFDRPDELQLDRFPNPHLVFSSGVHFCLGMQLARLEAQTALARLYARCSDLSLAAPDRIDWIERLGIRGPKSLPIRLRRSSERLAA